MELIVPLRRAAAVARKAVNDELVQTTIQYLNKTGGVLLEAHDEAHRDFLIEKLVNAGIKCGTVKHGPGTSVPVIVVTRMQGRAYNWGIRFGAHVRGVYPSSTAQRHQMTGRLTRIGQKREKIYVVTVVWEGSILERLLDVHSYSDQLNASLTALAETYDPGELIRAVGATLP